MIETTNIDKQFFFFQDTPFMTNILTSPCRKNDPRRWFSKIQAMLNKFFFMLNT